MSQQPHFTATETPADISANLTAGSYLAQVGGDAVPGAFYAVLFATAEIAPTDIDDYFRAASGQSFVFRAGPSILPTWVRTAPGVGDVDVARARTGN